MEVIPILCIALQYPWLWIVPAMPGINDADMVRISEFVKQTKFERSPEMLCPSDEEEEADDES
ncbi:hypothetical protein Halar_0648 (plasmid) [halophilic archaeon DL31]|jgi:hypothetical protein|nr:hypothetical protein Halar_0648 [halophilic archaeon DL31]